MILVESCLTGRLGDAYPAARHDLEIRLVGVPVSKIRAMLRAEAARLLIEFPECRKVVFAANSGDGRQLEEAQAAGFRYVVDVDIRSEDRASIEHLSLLVLEPAFVTSADPDLDRVPGS